MKNPDRLVYGLTAKQLSVTTLEEIKSYLDKEFPLESSMELARLLYALFHVE